MKSKPVEHLPGARLDIVEAFDWYELHEPGLGERFQASLAKAEMFVSRHPLLGQPHQFGTRKWPLKIFPYTLIYSDEPDLILVVALAHYSREPEYWHHRLRH